MADKIATVRLGSRVCFEDRWQGRVSGLEVDEDWNVLNISVSTGFLFTGSSVRLPFTSVTSYSDEAVHIAANSFKAFAREIPPVAAPARPLSSDTPISHPGARFAGLAVRPMDRRAVEVILSRGVGGLFRVPTRDVSFAGKTMTIAIESQQLVHYYPDSAIADELHRLITEDLAMPTDDKLHIKIDAEDGVVTLSGNVRVHTTRDYVGAVAAATPGVVSVNNQLHVDFDVEAAVGQALSTSGAATSGNVYVRSNLGEVLIDGFASSDRAAEDIGRAVARVPGVRKAVNRLRVAAAAR